MMCKNSDLRHCNERSQLGPSCTSAFLRSKFNSHGEQRRVARKRTKWKYKIIYSKQLHKTIKNDNGVEGWLRIIGIVNLEKPHLKQLIVFHTPSPHPCASTQRFTFCWMGNLNMLSWNRIMSLSHLSFLSTAPPRPWPFYPFPILK